MRSGFHGNYICRQASIDNMKSEYTRLGLLLLAVALVGACSTVPREMRQAPKDNPVLAEVRADADRYIGRQVRWGGTIITVDNDPVETHVEIVARDLLRSGRPLDTDHSTGRFIAEFPGFLDPAVYAAGRDITITGTVTGIEPGKIGEHDYTWPVIRVHHHYLWPLRIDFRRDYPARYYYYYDPWYPYFYFPRSPRPVIVHPPRTERPSPLTR
jgi:outer membrane lipoprotein